MTTEKTSPAESPVTFRDANYSSRIIKIGKDKLSVENGLVTTTNPAHIEALEKMHGMIKEK